MKRRSFIQTTGTVISLPILLNGFRLSAMPWQSLFNNINEETDRVLVLIQLNGGNDGLNTVLPLDQYSRLAAARSSLLLPENSVLGLSDTVGLHPAMSDLRNLYEEARLSIVQSVGYPDQNRSHFRSRDIWSSGSPATETWTTGWLGRFLDAGYPDFPASYPNDEMQDPFAITMGATVSETCQGAAANFSLTLNDPFSLTPLTQGTADEVPDTPYGEELTFLRTTIAQTNVYNGQITQAAELGSNALSYPDGNRLAAQLKNIALLISGGMRTKVYVANIGGFDTHANQVVDGQPGNGEHALLLGELSEAMAVFQADLQQQGLAERVITMTFSEFGRQIRANGSFGTDHGSAAPLFIAGLCVNPGIIGHNPEIPEEVQPQEGVPMQYDFRDVYGSVLMDWFEVPEAEVRQLLHEDFQHIPILNPCQTPVSTKPAALAAQPLELKVFPNPFHDGASLRFFSPGGRARLSVFNGLGSEIKVLAQGELPAGQHDFRFDASRLPAGNYYFRLQVGGQLRTSAGVKR